MIRVALLGVWFALLTGAWVSAQQRTSPLAHAATLPFSSIPRVHRAPKLEDFLQNRPREMELAVSDFRQNLPGDGIPATASTTAYLSYDDRNLSVVCHDEPGQVRAHLAKREATNQDNGVGVLLDTFRDFHRAYCFFFASSWRAD